MEASTVCKMNMKEKGFILVCAQLELHETKSFTCQNRAQKAGSEIYQIDIALTFGIKPLPTVGGGHEHKTQNVIF